MITYTVYFRSDAEFASHDIEANAPEQALALARMLYTDELHTDGPWTLECLAKSRTVPAGRRPRSARRRHASAGKLGAWRSGRGCPRLVPGRCQRDGQ